GGAGWGIEGRLQHPTLPPGMLVSGTTLAPVPDGTVLWSGGPIAVSVALDAPAQALGLSVVGGLVTVTASGAPIPGATVSLHDALGSNFTSPSVVTGANGSVPFQIYTANVTAMSADTVSATVTTFGYPGGASVAITLDPAVHLAVAPVHAAPTVGPGGTLQVAFVATEPDGSPAAGVYLTFATDAGSVAPLYALTGADGSASTSFTAPNSTEGVTIRAQVSGGGEWGEASVNVTVKPPTPPLLSPLEIDVVGRALFGGLLIGIGLLVRRQRARRPPVPPMRFPKRTAPSAPLPAPTEGPGPAPNRTPPGSGAP
ncbi:MAG: hypothetical protein L3J91_04320, partial [Thermoplasmata archaeon]|nr:hypothetical protein [Thermoplasmata archaeon]